MVLNEIAQKLYNQYLYEKFNYSCCCLLTPRKYYEAQNHNHHEHNHLASLHGKAFSFLI